MLLPLVMRDVIASVAPMVDLMIFSKLDAAISEMIFHALCIRLAGSLSDV